MDRLERLILIYINEITDFLHNVTVNLEVGLVQDKK